MSNEIEVWKRTLKEIVDDLYDKRLVHNVFRLRPPKSGPHGIILMDIRAFIDRQDGELFATLQFMPEELQPLTPESLIELVIERIDYGILCVREQAQKMRGEEGSDAGSFKFLSPEEYFERYPPRSDF